jgi:hypothetical protein
LTFCYTSSYRSERIFQLKASTQGFFPQTLWELPENAPLREKRESPNILRAGDEVFIPDLRIKQQTAPVNMRHRFKRKGVPEILRVRFLDELGEPRAGLKYEFKIGDLLRKGETDEGGWLVEWIPPDAMEASILLRDETGETPIEEKYDVQLGRLNPSKDTDGIRARLENLGIVCGETEEDFSQAISSFQNRYDDLEVTGVADEKTVARLKELHLS